ncbi:response regulator [Butyrivibrio sp. ob235]|uniref:response regulator n=1 Tax=Butyrivibrio sp. ob235 TaxID=1761780 RepID=UPI000A6D26DA|nr:response regulator [Butyrivibrio sp. ob235]
MIDYKDISRMITCTYEGKMEMMENYKILCVDDDINMLNTLEDILINAGYSVSLSKSGRQAIEFVRKGIGFSLILLDVDMPGMDGYETLKEIKDLHMAKDIPVIFLTAKDEPDFEIKGFEYGAADYITKPFVKSVFLARVRNRITAPSRQKAIEAENLGKLRNMLSDLELKVAEYIAEGLSNQEIADKTSYSYGYVRRVVSSILDKTGMEKRTDIRHFLKSGEY